MIIIRYGDDSDIEQLNFTIQHIRASTKEDVLAIPYDLDILFNCSTDELEYLIKKIREQIRKKEIVEEM